MTEGLAITDYHHQALTNSIWGKERDSQMREKVDHQSLQSLHTHMVSQRSPVNAVTPGSHEDRTNSGLVAAKANQVN